MHENVAKKWIEKENSNVIVSAKFTEGAIRFIKDKCEVESSVIVTLRNRYVGSRKGPYSLALAEVRLGLADPSHDFVKVESNVGITVLVTREIYELFDEEKIPLIIITSGFGRFKKLNLKQDLSWLMYSKEEMRRKRIRWSTV